MNDNLKDELAKLKLQTTVLKKTLDARYYDKNLRQKTFDEIKKTTKEIAQIEFKMKLEKEMKKNEDNNTN